MDYDWPGFLSRAEAFVKDVDDPDTVMELIEVLDPRWVEPWGELGIDREGEGDG